MGWVLRSEKLYRFSTCSSHRYNEFWPIWLAPTALVGFLTCFLHLLNRQGAKYLVFVSSRSVKMRELSFAQFVYFLKKVCLFFNFWMIEFTVMFCLTWLWILSFKNWKIRTHFPQKVYKLSKTKFSHFDRTRGDKNQIFPTQSWTCLSFWLPVAVQIEFRRRRSRYHARLTIMCHLDELSWLFTYRFKYFYLICRK